MDVAEPLKGVTVLDFGQVYNGPYCGFLLAQAGARVIKIESTKGETLRGPGRPVNGTYPFATLNRGKECITLNIKKKEGQNLVRRLVEYADVLLENFAPGTLAKYGLGSDDLRSINPGLIYASSTGYGGTGLYKDYLGMDITLQAMTGIMSVTGQADGPPQKAGAALCDFLGGIHTYAGIVSALYERARTGIGSIVDVSMQDCVFPTLLTQLGAYFQQGEQRPRTGNRHAGLAAAPYNVYEAKDGHVAIISIREGHWRKLCEAMGEPGLASDERFSSVRLRSKNMDELDEAVEKWTRRYNKAEIFSKAQAFGVICAPVQNLEDVVNDPHLHERGSLVWLKHEGVGEAVFFNTPIRFKGKKTPHLKEVAPLGEHNHAILSEMLGLSEEELKSLKEEDVI